MKVSRGATTVLRNKTEEVKNATLELFNKIAEENNLDLNKVFYIVFICTRDIKCANPATLLRQNNEAIKDVPLMCQAHHEYKGALKKCIRLSVFTEQDVLPKHIYLNGAKKLREDITND